MLKSVLFDIDNTLILFNEARFFKSYLPRITRAFDGLLSPDLFQKRLMSATQALFHKGDSLSNAEFFLQEFSKGMEEKRPSFWSRFIRFYETEFDSLRSLVTPVQGVKQILTRLERMGVSLVAASNPVWPLVVQKIRLSWAGADDLPYALITHIENTRFCKPRLEFYGDICETLNLTPQSCLMVGNDLRNDMIASRIGMKTYLTTDSSTDEFSNLKMSREIAPDTDRDLPVPDCKGPLSRLPMAVENFLQDRPVSATGGAEERR